MAAILPAIGLSNSQIHASTLDSSEVKMASNLTPKTVQVREIVLKRRLKRHEQQFSEKQQQLRSLVPRLTVRQTADFRNTYKHRLCSEILESGHHRSFAELFGLIKVQMENRTRAGPESSLWLQKVLTEEPEKLDTMKKYLIDAENALLINDYIKVYECYRLLAQYFQSFGSEYKWLADHFYRNCLVWSSAVKDDGGKVAADGHCNFGLSLKESGKYADAMVNFELFYSLTKDRPDWSTEDGSTSMHGQACVHLAEIYMIIAEQKYAEGDSVASLDYLKRAHEMAKEGGDRRLLAEAGYHLGVAHERNADSETALTFLQNYLEACRSLRDNEGIGKACDAIAKSYESCGRIDDCIKYLQMFIKVSEDNNDDEGLSQACRSLGIRFNTLGRYDQAAIYFEKSYNISRSGSETNSVSKARALFGIAKSHSMLKDYIQHVENSEWPCVSRLIAWKDSRMSAFDKPLETTKTVPSGATGEQIKGTEQVAAVSESPEKIAEDCSATEPGDDGGGDDDDCSATEPGDDGGGDDDGGQ